MQLCPHAQALADGGLDHGDGGVAFAEAGRSDEDWAAAAGAVGGAQILDGFLLAGAEAHAASAIRSRPHWSAIASAMPA